MLEGVVLEIRVKEAIIETIIDGEGPPIILLSGHGQHIDSLKSITQRLTEYGFKTISINLRGIGKSKGSLENITLHDLAADVAGVIVKLNIAPVNVLGHAFGNRVARCLATDHTHLVKSVIILAAGGHIPPKPEIMDAMIKLGEPKITHFERRILQKICLISPATDPVVLDQLPDRQPEVIQAHRLASRAVPVDYWWDAGDKPILVIQGLDDVIAVPENGRFLKYQHGDRVTLIELPNAGHLLQLEKPEEIVKHIHEYLSKP